MSDANEEKKNIINLENILHDIVSRGCYEYYDEYHNLFRLTIKGYIVLLIILKEIELNPIISIKELRVTLKIMLKYFVECMIKNFNSIIYARLHEITNFELTQGYPDYDEENWNLLQNGFIGDTDIHECCAIDFFVHSITKKFGYSKDCIIGKYHPTEEHELLFENVTENSVLTERAINIGIFTYEIEQTIQSLDDVLT